MNERIKKSGTGVGELAAIAVFMIGLWLLFAFGDSLAAWEIDSTFKIFLLFFVLYVGAQLAAVLIDFLQGNHKATFRNFVILWSGYLFMTLINLVIWVLLIPIIALQFLLGPVAFFVGFMSLATLLIYFVQHILGFDWVGHPPTPQTAKWAMVGLTACLAAFGLVYYWVKKNINPEDILIDFWIDKVADPADRLYKEWLGYLDS